jgi:PTS system nitrogen regulatory IIA component
MRLSDILPVERIVPRIDVTDKRTALRALARIFVANDPALTEDDVYRVLSEREALASTGVGSGVAIPHGRMRGLERMQAALALCPGGVGFDAVDGAPAQIFVALLAPERHTGDHLKALARISRLMRDASVRERLLHAADRDALLQVVVEEDARH